MEQKGLKPKEEIQGIHGQEKENTFIFQRYQDYGWYKEADHSYRA